MITANLNHTTKTLASTLRKRKIEPYCDLVRVERRLIYDHVLVPS